jgi:poly(hydroxyalkanoate) depolymerase family esterase
MPFRTIRDLTGTARQVSTRLGEASAGLQRLLRDGRLPAATGDSIIQTIDNALTTAFGRSPYKAPEAPSPGNGQFLSAVYSNAAGTRPYKLYVPASLPAHPVPLIVMLHGCTQSPDDFALGTRMNQAAEANSFLVCYPEQILAANQSKCWNWFQTQDQSRGQGEPSLVVGIVHDVMQNHAVDPRRIYVAGLSAGGAAAATLGSAYPDLFAAVGVHSGLACGAAHDLASAFAAMRNGAPGADCTRTIPTIVFHGDRDTTVNPANADQVLAQTVPGRRLHRRERNGEVPNGHAYTVVTHEDETGTARMEQWTIHGAGHAWSGGNPAGSYTDPKGPDATGAMLRFFGVQAGMK